jgi:hypothetical protein
VRRYEIGACWVLTMPIRFWLVILVIVVAIAWALTKMILS